MKLILKQHLSGADGVFKVGDTIEVSELQAVAFVEKGIAGFKTTKEEEAFNNKIADIKAKKLEEEAKVNAILKQGEIQNDLNALYLQVVEKEAALNGEVLTEQEAFEAVEAIAKRDAVSSKKK